MQFKIQNKLHKHRFYQVFFVVGVDDLQVQCGLSKVGNNSDCELLGSMMFKSFLSVNWCLSDLYKHFKFNFIHHFILFYSFRPNKRNSWEAIKFQSLCFHECHCCVSNPFFRHCSLAHLHLIISTYLLSHYQYSEQLSQKRCSGCSSLSN